MGENTKIESCDHTFNPWIGCSKVAAGCEHCYAEALAKRTGLAEWGAQGTRVKTSESYWRKPLKWNRDAERDGVRRRVFCSSMADVFEDWRGEMIDHMGRIVYRTPSGVLRGAGKEAEMPHYGFTSATIGDLRIELFALIDDTPNLDWLLLTKRPENILRMWPAGRTNRSNVWLGTSIASQHDAERNIPPLLKCRDLARVLFVSAEPLLGPVHLNANRLGVRPWHDETWLAIDWLIVGGESGPHARLMHPEWARSLRDQCQAAGVPFFFKQWGDVCKSETGRLLDGREWNEFPSAGENTFSEAKP